MTGISYWQTSCGTFDGLVNDVTEAGGTGGKVLTVTSGGTFRFQWKTPSATGCYKLAIALADGTTQSALFDLK